MDRSALALAALWGRSRPVTDAELEQFLAAATPVVAAAQRQAAGLGVAYIAAATGERLTELVDIEEVIAGLRAGAARTDVYSRPTITARTALAGGKPWVDAMKIGAERLDATVRADVQLAGRGGTYEAMQTSTRVVGWRRIPDAKACRLCLQASTQRYTTDDLMAIHNRCGCTVAPIIGDRDPGHIINHEVNNALKADKQLGTFGHRDGFEIHDHGELGPVLTVKGQQFTQL